MTGIVKARVEVYKDGSADVVPDTCAVEDEHRQDVPRCYHVIHTGERRACVFWAALTSPAQKAERMDLYALVSRAQGLGARTVNCQVICHAARRNRPPGC